MKIYLVKSMLEIGYDMYDSIVVVAKHKKDALNVANRIGIKGQWTRDSLEYVGDYVGDENEGFILHTSYQGG